MKINKTVRPEYLMQGSRDEDGRPGMDADAER